jgi:hypothetical protein
MIAGKTNGNENQEIKVMYIDGALFRRYIDEYPDFRRFLILRSSIRRAYFNYLMKLKCHERFLMNTFDECEKEAK